MINDANTALGKAKVDAAVDDMQIDILKRLKRPEGIADVVLDTDTFNEIDDQFALAYLIKSDDRLNLQAIYAAPFFNSKSASALDGMEKSYREIMNILELMGRDDLKSIVYKGSDRFLADEKTFVDSPAARDIVKRALEHTPEKPLYVIAIAAITNVASAILMDERVAERVTVVWLGGHALDWGNTREFNMYQDVAGARVLFDSGAAVVQLPCMNVVNGFRATGPELEHHLRGKNALCDYLVDVTAKEAKACGGNSAWSRPIWDVATIGWMLGNGFTRDRLEHAPIPEYDDRYSFDPTRNLYKYVYYVDRDRLFEDLFRKLAK